MSEAGIVGVIGIVATLVGTIAGSWLTAYFGGREGQRQRQDSHRGEARIAVASTLSSGRDWSRTAKGFAIVLASQESITTALELMEKVPDSYTGSELLTHSKAFAEACTEAGLLIEDKDVFAQLAVIRILHEQWGKHCVGKITSSIEESSLDKVGRVELAVKYHQGFDDALTNLEHLARKLMASMIREAST